jgi:AbrB family looped-hinge helix DNA binding protein
MWEIYFYIGGKLEIILRLDEKGRILIPAEIRRALGLSEVVKARVEEEKLILEAMQDPLEALVEMVVNKEGNIEKDIQVLRKAALEALGRAK